MSTRTYYQLVDAGDGYAELEAMRLGLVRVVARFAFRTDEDQKTARFVVEAANRAEIDAQAGTWQPQETQP